MTFLNDFLVFLLFHSMIIQINKTRPIIDGCPESNGSEKMSFFSVNYLVSGETFTSLRLTKKDENINAKAQREQSRKAFNFFASFFITLRLCV